MALLLVLAEQGGALSTADAGQRADVQRDTARRILRQLADAGWVRPVAGAGEGDRWVLGPELPRLGLDYQRRLVEAARELKADWDRCTAPITLHVEKS